MAISEMLSYKGSTTGSVRVPRHDGNSLNEWKKHSWKREELREGEVMMWDLT